MPALSWNQTLDLASKLATFTAIQLHARPLLEPDTRPRFQTRHLHRDPAWPSPPTQPPRQRVARWEKDELSPRPVEGCFSREKMVGRGEQCSRTEVASLRTTPSSAALPACLRLSLPP